VIQEANCVLKENRIEYRQQGREPHHAALAAELRSRMPAFLGVHSISPLVRCEAWHSTVTVSIPWLNFTTRIPYTSGMAFSKLSSRYATGDS